MCREPMLAGAPAGPVSAGDLVRRNFVLLNVAPGEPDEYGVGGRDADGHQPPDVPDERKSGKGGEEGRDKAGRTVPRQFDRLVIGLRYQLLRFDSAPLDLPIRLLPLNVGKYGEVEG